MSYRKEKYMQKSHKTKKVSRKKKRRYIRKRGRRVLSVIKNSHRNWIKERKGWPQLDFSQCLPINIYNPRPQEYFSQSFPFCWLSFERCIISTSGFWQETRNKWARGFPFPLAMTREDKLTKRKRKINNFRILSRRSSTKHSAFIPLLSNSLFFRRERGLFLPQITIQWENGKPAKSGKHTAARFGMQKVSKARAVGCTLSEAQLPITFGE